MVKGKKTQKLSQVKGWARAQEVWTIDQSERLFRSVHSAHKIITR
jgi:hypothetical protein